MGWLTLLMAVVVTTAINFSLWFAVTGNRLGICVTCHHMRILGFAPRINVCLDCQSTK